MNPCDRRPRLGTFCAKLFGGEYAKVHGKFPTRKEVWNHTTLNWSKQHLENLYRHACDGAREFLTHDNGPLALKYRLEKVEGQNLSLREDIKNRDKAIQDAGMRYSYAYKKLIKE